jgi:hypothetical protein
MPPADSPSAAPAKAPIVWSAVVAGALGGIAPILIHVIRTDSAGNLAGIIVAMGAGVLLGGAIAFVFQEDNLRKAFFLGIAAPGIINGVSAGTSTDRATGGSGSAMNMLDRLVPAAYAQLPPLPPGDREVKLVLTGESGTAQAQAGAASLNRRLWITAGDSTLPYWTSGDTIIVRLPAAARSLVLTPGSFSREYGLEISIDRFAGGVLPVVVKDNSFWKSLWGSFGNGSVPDVKLETKK